MRISSKTWEEPTLVCKSSTYIYKRDKSMMVNGISNQLPQNQGNLLRYFEFTPDVVQDFTKWVASEIKINDGSDGSKLEGHGAHSFVWTSSVERTVILSRSATTLGNREEMTSQRAEPAGSVVVLIMFHILQQVPEDLFFVVLWVDNVEVLQPGQDNGKKLQWSETLVLDFDLQILTRKVQQTITYPLTWGGGDGFTHQREVEEGLNMTIKG